VGTRYEDSDTRAAKSYDLESVKKPRSIEEQIGRKAESKTEEEPRRKISDYMKSSGPFSNVGAAVESATSKGTESSAPAAVKKAMKVAEKAEPKKAAPKKEEAESKYEDTGAKVGSQGSFKFDSKPMSVEEARKKAKEMTSSRKEPTEAQKESGRKFSEEKLKKQKESFESSPVGGFLRRLGESPMEKAERKAKEIRGYKSGGKVSSASSRADGIAQRGKTRGRIC
jgi:hypothetical protein